MDGWGEGAVIAALAGSLREKSVNRGLIRAACELLPAGVRVENLPLGELPHYNMDLEVAEPDAVRTFKARLRSARAILIATPEFNGSVPGVLKNALDWASRPAGKSPMAAKPTAIMGAGGRGGTAQAQGHLREVLARLGVPVLPGPVVQVANSWQKFDADGNLVDGASRALLRELLDALLSAAGVPTRVGA